MNDAFSSAKILSTTRVLELIIGQYSDQTIPMKSFLSKVVSAFLSTLVQFALDYTRDVAEFIRLGRSLWPKYIRPLSSNLIDETIEIAQKEASRKGNSEVELEREILKLIGQRFFKNHTSARSGVICRLFLSQPIKHTSDSTIAPPVGSSHPFEMDMPYLRSCLLLAAFICQNNRPDQDHKVFLVQGNGKRRNRTRERMNAGENEAFASSSSDIQQLKSLRPRPIQLERVFSIFATLVQLNPESFAGMDDQTKGWQFLGSKRLYSDLAQLTDLGYLHPIVFNGSVKSEQVNLNAAKYWCSLTKEEAVRVAKRFDIPLESYIV